VDEDGRKMEPFYKLAPRGNTTSEFSNTPVSFFKAYRDIMKSEIEEILADKKTIEQALQSIQDRAQAELIKAKKAEEASSASPSASSSPSAAKP
jgi:multiple sugar transport system substrate-binding protein